MSDSLPEIAGPVVVELMGHRKLAGVASVQEVAGASFLRIDVPGPDGEPRASPLYSPQAIYSFLPVTDEVMRATAAKYLPAALNNWDVQELIEQEVERRLP